MVDCSHHVSFQDEPSWKQIAKSTTEGFTTYTTDLCTIVEISRIDNTSDLDWITTAGQYWQLTSNGVDISTCTRPIVGGFEVHKSLIHEYPRLRFAVPQRG